MRFEFYHSGLDLVPKLSVDGTVPNSIHFSHWEGNETPFEVKADTSTEIVLNLVASPNRQKLTKGIELVTNNHFDTDGLLSVWTALAGERALEFRDKLIPSAEAGDFCEFKDEAGVKASIVFQGPDQPSPSDDSGSPLANYLASEVIEDEAQIYEVLLPEVTNVLTRLDNYEVFWRAGWDRVATAVESFERGDSTVTEFEDGLSLIALSPEIFGSGHFDPSRDGAPYTAISRYAKGSLFLIATPLREGWAYRIDYPYYSWAETVVRPRIQRRELSEMLVKLNQLETGNDGVWKFDKSEMTSAIKFLGADEILTASRLQPDQVVKVLREEASSNPAAPVGARMSADNAS